MENFESKSVFFQYVRDWFLFAPNTSGNHRSFLRSSRNQQKSLKLKTSEVIINAGDAFELPILIHKPNTILQWVFHSQDYDIDFYITGKEGSNVVQDETEVVDGEEKYILISNSEIQLKKPGFMGNAILFRVDKEKQILIPYQARTQCFPEMTGLFSRISEFLSVPMVKDALSPTGQRAYLA